MRRRHAAGFTLVEVIIALTLLALIMLALISALRTFGDSGARLEARSERADDMRLISGFLRQVISEASIIHLRRLEDGTQVPDFIGLPAALEWQAPMPARHGVGGLHWLRLWAWPEGDQFDLILQFAPYIPPVPGFESDPAVRPDWDTVAQRILVRRVTSLAIAYQRRGRDDWQENWNDPQVLPGRVAIRLQVDGVDWPELIVPVLAAERGFDPNESALERAQ